MDRDSPDRLPVQRAEVRAVAGDEGVAAEMDRGGKHRAVLFRHGEAGREVGIPRVRPGDVQRRKLSPQRRDTVRKLRGEAERAGSPLPVIDSLIAATALHHGLTVVTRNTRDLERCSAACFDPWAGR